MKRLESLAAAYRRLVSRTRVSKSAAASVLTVVLISFSLTGCSALGDLTVKDWGDILVSVGQLLGILPDEVDARTPMEFIQDKWGENFQESIEAWVVKISSMPNLEEGILGQINKAATFIGFGLSVLFVLGYLQKMKTFRKKYGSVAVNEGMTALIPPSVYLPKRFLPVTAVILGGLLFLQTVLRLTHNGVVGFARAFYVEKGETIGSLSFTLTQKLLDGADIWVLAFLIFIIVPVFVIFMVWLLVRFGLLELYFLRMMIQSPVCLTGTNYDHLGEPLHLLFKRVLVLGTMWLVLFFGFLLIDTFNAQGFPVALGILVVLLAGIGAPWILFAWYKPSAKWMSDKTVGWFDDFDTYPVDPSVFPDEWQHQGFFGRMWNRVPRSAQMYIGGQTKVATTLLKTRPEFRGAQIAANYIQEGREVLRGDRDLGETIATRFQGKEPPPVQPSEPVPDISRGDLDSLVEHAMAAGLHLTKNEFSDKELAVIAELVAAGSASTSVDDRRKEARRIFRDMNKKEQAFWTNRGYRLRRRL